MTNKTNMNLLIQFGKLAFFDSDTYVLMRFFMLTNFIFTIAVQCHINVSLTDSQKELIDYFVKKIASGLINNLIEISRELKAKHKSYSYFPQEDYLNCLTWLLIKYPLSISYIKSIMIDINLIRLHLKEIYDDYFKQLVDENGRTKFIEFLVKISIFNSSVEINRFFSLFALTHQLVSENSNKEQGSNKFLQWFIDQAIQSVNRFIEKDLSSIKYEEIYLNLNDFFDDLSANAFYQL